MDENERCEVVLTPVRRRKKTYGIDRLLKYKRIGPGVMHHLLVAMKAEGLVIVPLNGAEMEDLHFWLEDQGFMICKMISAEEVQRTPRVPPVNP